MDIRSAAAFVAANPAAAQEAQRHMQPLLARSATDLAFREKLVTDPRAAMAEYKGVDVSEIPESFEVRFIEPTGDGRRPNEWTIVLPPVAIPGAELSDAELEGVAGGTWLACAVGGILLWELGKEAYRVITSEY